MLIVLTMRQPVKHASGTRERIVERLWPTVVEEVCGVHGEHCGEGERDGVALDGLSFDAAPRREYEERDERDRYHRRERDHRELRHRRKPRGQSDADGATRVGRSQVRVEREREE